VLESLDRRARRWTELSLWVGGRRKAQVRQTALELYDGLTLVRLPEREWAARGELGPGGLAPYR